MSFKKKSIVVLVGLLPCFAIYAAQNPFIPNPQAENDFKNNGNTFIYIEGNLGYARQNYFADNQWNAPIQAPGEGTNYSNNTNVYGGFTGGVDAGYEINSHFAAEFGWFYLPSVNVMQQGTAPAYLSSWALYLAAKYLMPIAWMNNTTAFFKFGVAYRQATLSAAALAANSGYNTSTSQSTYVRPMFAAGLDYHFNASWFGALQYAYFMGANNSFPLLTQNTGALGTLGSNVFTAGLGYRFAV